MQLCNYDLNSTSKVGFSNVKLNGFTYYAVVLNCFPQQGIAFKNIVLSFLPLFFVKVINYNYLFTISLIKFEFFNLHLKIMCLHTSRKDTKITNSYIFYYPIWRSLMSNFMIGRKRITVPSDQKKILLFIWISEFLGLSILYDSCHW